MITDKAVNAINPEFARILALWTKGVSSGAAVSREAEQMVFPRGDFAQLVRKDTRDVLGAPLSGSLINPMGGR